MELGIEVKIGSRSAEYASAAASVQQEIKAWRGNMKKAHHSMMFRIGFKRNKNDCCSDVMKETQEYRLISTNGCPTQNWIWVVVKKRPCGEVWLERDQNPQEKLLKIRTFGGHATALILKVI